MIFCGAGSFSHIDDGNDPPPPSSPKCCKKKQSSRSKNPYSTRGLDKFSKVMSELEEKRVKIMSAAAGEQGLPMVRFMNNSSDDWIPVIFKLQDSPPKQTATKKSIKRTQSLPPASQQTSNSKTAAGAAELKKKTSFSGGAEECWGRRSKSYYWPVVMMVILLGVVMFGRVFAICCTSIWWYLAPILMRPEAIERKSQRLIKKKDYLRHASKKTLQPQPKIKGSY